MTAAEQVADILREHPTSQYRWWSDYTTYCTGCLAGLPDDSTDALFRHQADMLAAAGLVTS